LPLKTKPTAV